MKNVDAERNFQPLPDEPCHYKEDIEKELCADDCLQRMVDHICFLIRMQIELTIQKKRRKSDHPFITIESLGYIFGFVDGYQMAMNLQDKNKKMTTMVGVMIKILGEYSGVECARKALEMQQNGVFDEARKIGGKQAIAFLKNNTIPMGLSHILLGRSLEKVCEFT